MQIILVDLSCALVYHKTFILQEKVCIISVNFICCHCVADTLFGDLCFAAIPGVFVLVADEDDNGSNQDGEYVCHEGDCACFAWLCCFIPLYLRLSGKREREIVVCQLFYTEAMCKVYHKGQICSDEFMCCRTETEVADQTCYDIQSQYRHPANLS